MLTKQEGDMSFATVSKGKYWVVKSETLTVTTTTDKEGSSFTVPPGQDFLVGIYNASTASNTLDVDVDASFDGTTFATSFKADVIANKAVTAGTIAVGNYDISANGEAPYYRLRIDPDASVSDTTLDYITYVAFHRREMGKDY
jgi:hypothetical protein